MTKSKRYEGVKCLPVISMEVSTSQIWKAIATTTKGDEALDTPCYITACIAAYMLQLQPSVLQFYYVQFEHPTWHTMYINCLQGTH